MSISGDRDSSKDFSFKRLNFRTSPTDTLIFPKNISVTKNTKSLFWRPKLLYLYKRSGHLPLLHFNWNYCFILYYSAFIEITLGIQNSKTAKCMKLKNKQLVIYHILSLLCLFLIDHKRHTSRWSELHLFSLSFTVKLHDQILLLHYAKVISISNKK